MIPLLSFLSFLHTPSWPLISAITIWSDSASSWRRTMTVSPSMIRGDIESPFIRRPKYSPVLAISEGISSLSIISLIASIGIPAATLPSTGILTLIRTEEDPGCSIRSARVQWKNSASLSIVSKDGIELPLHQLLNV